VLHRFADLTRTELRNLGPGSTAVVPIGSVEQHGPHLPVSTDFTIVSAIAERAAARAGDVVPIVLVPPLPFGFAHHHLPFGGTISIGMSTYSNLLCDMGRSLSATGFRRILLLNGHGGNDSPMREVLDRLAFEDGLDVHAAATSYWTCAAGALAAFAAQVGPIPGHAGSFETSCMLALRPDLVRTDLMPAPEAEYQPLARSDLTGGVVRRSGIWQDSDGRTDDSRSASRQLGEQMLDVITEQVARFIIAFHESVPQ
jgi:creatinine amidohydrolase